MKKNRLFLLTAVLILGGTVYLSAQRIANNSPLSDPSQAKAKKVLYFNPEVYPNLEEIKEPTNLAFFSAVSDEVSGMKNNRMLRVESPLEFDKVDAQAIKDFCKNNNADFAVIPKVKYFKVGVGQYVFSNQVVVSMKLYDADGNYISESSYDTYRRNYRLLGSTENSVKIGTAGAIKDILKDLRKSGRQPVSNSFQ